MRIRQRCEEIGSLDRKRFLAAQTHLTKLISESVWVGLSVRRRILVEILRRSLALTLLLHCKLLIGSS